MSHMCSYIYTVLRVLEYWRSPTKSVTCMTLPLPPLLLRGGGGGGGVILAAWEIWFPQESGCEDVTAWVVLCRPPLVFV